MSKNPRGANSKCILRLPVRHRSCAIREAFDTTAIANCRRRRLLDRDQHVVLVAAAVRQLRDLDAAKESERAQPAPALELILQADRLTGLELQLAQDDLRLGVRVADDEDVVDDALRAFLDDESRYRPWCDPGSAASIDVDLSGCEPAVEVLEQPARRAPRRRAVRNTGSPAADLDERPQLVGGNRRRCP